MGEFTLQLITLPPEVFKYRPQVLPLPMVPPTARVVQRPTSTQKQLQVVRPIATANATITAMNDYINEQLQ